jgi:hypothetical protein
MLHMNWKIARPSIVTRIYGEINIRNSILRLHFVRSSVRNTHIYPNLLLLLYSGAGQ